MAESAAHLPVAKDMEETSFVIFLHATVWFSRSSRQEDPDASISRPHRSKQTDQRLRPVFSATMI